MSNSGNFGGLVFLAVLGIGYYEYPSGEDWMPPSLNGPVSSYFDRNTLSWSGNVVSLSIKGINSNGTPMSTSQWTIQGKYPQGWKMDITLDCQQHIVKFEKAFIFLKEGQYAPVSLSDEELNATQVLKSNDNEDKKILALCDSERPSWHLFRYKWFRDLFPRLSSKA
jgi:hypothetical protein